MIATGWISVVGLRAARVGGHSQALPGERIVHPYDVGGAGWIAHLMRRPQPSAADASQEIRVWPSVVDESQEIPV